MSRKLKKRINQIKKKEKILQRRRLMNEIAPVKMHTKVAEPGVAEKVLHNLPFVVCGLLIISVLAKNIMV